MSVKECIWCKRLFTCAGRTSKAPCVCFEDRRKHERTVKKSESNREEK